VGRHLGRASMTRARLPEVIVTGRLRLRSWRVGDADDVFAYAQDPEWSRYLRTLPRPYTREDAEKFIARQILLDPVRHPAWAVEHEGTVIGGINVGFDFEHLLGEIGYSIAPVHWNKGICTEAARAVVDAAFATHADLNRLHARADADNTASQRVMEKVGMVKEGVLRMSKIERGEAIDEAWFAILRSEWENRRPD
jgi:ribosomal-protein-alanine N-acetyltransferase